MVEYNSKGNGALMRALPLVYSTWNMTLTEREAEIKRWSEITHPNEISTLCCFLYVDLMRSLIETGTKKGLDKIAYAMFKDQLNIDLYTFRPGSQGSCDDTLITAVKMFLLGNDYSSVILNTINLGGDTDTNAMVAGTLASAIYPINEKWYDSLRRKDLIDSVR